MSGSLEEVSVLTAAHGAEWATAGIHTDFKTKSGSNQYRGTFYSAAEHRRRQSSNVDADQRDERFHGRPAQCGVAVDAIWSSGASFLRPLTIVSPRIARIGLNVNW